MMHKPKTEEDRLWLERIRPQWTAIPISLAVYLLVFVGEYAEPGALSDPGFWLTALVSAGALTLVFNL
jgi:hypothetical protein